MLSRSCTMPKMRRGKNKYGEFGEMGGKLWNRGKILAPKLCTSRHRCSHMLFIVPARTLLKQKNQKNIKRGVRGIKFLKKFGTPYHRHLWFLRDQTSRDWWHGHPLWPCTIWGVVMVGLFPIMGGQFRDFQKILALKVYIFRPYPRTKYCSL